LQGVGTPLKPELLLQAYAAGIFPMAESRDDPHVFWVDPRVRGILPLDGFHVSRSLARTIRQGRFRISFDTVFARVIDGCADRPETWINPTIRRLCLSLHELGSAHSAEVWQGTDLVGGVYGISLGGAFFGESMFSTRPDASKVALAYLVDRLHEAGFVLFDTQFITPHLASLGAIEIPRADYRRRLTAAIEVRARFPPRAPVPAPQELLQRMTQTS
jgi:leucyl/phenylalanyl-tRNA---protein transferase